MAKTPILSPVGRMIGGSLYKPQTKNMDGSPILIKSGPDAGKPGQRFVIVLAVPKKPGENDWKTDTDFGKLIASVAAAGMPQAVNRRDFAYKVVNGDSTEYDQSNPPKRWCDKPNHAGHWVLRMSSGYAPKVYQLDGSNRPVLWDQPDAVKLGDWIEVAGTVDVNNNATKPGVYINHNMVCFRGYGERISTGPDADAVGFGAAAAPAGASNVPPAGFTPPATTAPPVPAPAAPAPAAPPPVTAVTPVPMVPTAPPVPAPAAERTASKDGTTWPLKTMTDGGWTEQTLLAAGYVIS